MAGQAPGWALFVSQNLGPSALSRPPIMTTFMHSVWRTLRSYDIRGRQDP